MKHGLVLFLLPLLAIPGALLADGLPGTIIWSDGKTQSGDLSLSPGKDLHIFTPLGQTVVRLEDVREMRFVPEKEEMFEGFYFPLPGQPVQKKTGEVYPIRYLEAELALNNGQTLSGHLITTVLYLSNDDGTKKVILEAKQKGADKEKLSDLIYACTIQFTGAPKSSGSSKIDLSKAGLQEIRQVTAYAKPDLTPLLLTAVSDSPNTWTAPYGDSSKIILCVQTADGFHISWPKADDPAASQAVGDYLKLMEDFYDTRTLIGCFTDPGTEDTYSIVMMSRVAASVDASVPHPYSLVLLRWKYDATAKKATLLNRVPIVVERLEGNSSLPAVFKEDSLFHCVHP